MRACETEFNKYKRTDSVVGYDGFPLPKTPTPAEEGSAIGDTSGNGSVPQSAGSGADATRAPDAGARETAIVDEIVAAAATVPVTDDANDRNGDSAVVNRIYPAVPPALTEYDQRFSEMAQRIFKSAENTAKYLSLKKAFDPRREWWFRILCAAMDMQSYVQGTNGIQISSLELVLYEYCRESDPELN